MSEAKPKIPMYDPRMIFTRSKMVTRHTKVGNGNTHDKPNEADHKSWREIMSEVRDPTKKKNIVEGQEKSYKHPQKETSSSPNIRTKYPNTQLSLTNPDLNPMMMSNTTPSSSTIPPHIIETIADQIERLSPSPFYSLPARRITHR